MLQIQAISTSECVGSESVQPQVPMIAAPMNHLKREESVAPVVCSDDIASVPGSVCQFGGLSV